MTKKKMDPVIISESDLSKYITLEEFAEMYDLTPKTVKKRADEIPGLDYTQHGYLALIGTRYPCKYKRYALDSSAKRRFVLLRAISANEYISHRELAMPEDAFNFMLHECEQLGWIAKLDVPNNAGANSYVCTVDGEEFLRKYAKNYSPNKWERLERNTAEIIRFTIETGTKAIANAAIEKIFSGNVGGE